MFTICYWHVKTLLSVVPNGLKVYNLKLRGKSSGLRFTTGDSGFNFCNLQLKLNHEKVGLSFLKFQSIHYT